MSTDKKHAFALAAVTKHSASLRRFLAARLRNAQDAPDLLQEVYLRVLRVERSELIRSPEAYLFTVASNLASEHGLRQAAAPVTIEIAGLFDQLQTAPEDDPEALIETQQRLQQLERVLQKLSPKARAAVVLHRRDGYTVDEIAAQLRISRGMVKKYLARALIQCRLHLDQEKEE